MDPQMVERLAKRLSSVKEVSYPVQEACREGPPSKGSPVWDAPFIKRRLNRRSVWACFVPRRSDSVASKGCQAAERLVGEVFSTKEASGPVVGVVPFMVRFMLSAVQIEVK